MPYPNFHAARVRQPGDFARIAVLQTLPNGIMIYGGPLKTDPRGSGKPQAYRFPKDKFTVAQAKSWLENHNIKPISFEPASEANMSESFLKVKEIKDLEDDKLYSITGKPMLKVGTFKASTGKVTITEEILDNMLESFNNLKGIKRVPFILGHSSKLKDSSPACGWIENINKVGKTLLMDISHIPGVIMKLIKNKGYRDVSIELLSEWIDGSTGQKFKDVLQAVALLGAKNPAVPGLEDFEVTFSTDDNDFMCVNYSEIEDLSDLSDAETNRFNEDNKKKEEISDMEAKELQEKIDAQAKELKLKEDEAKKVADENKKLAEENAKLKEEQARALAAQKEEAINKFMESVTSEENMKVLPKDKKLVTDILKSLDVTHTVKFSEGDKEIDLPLDKAFMKFIEGLPDATNLFIETSHNEAESKKLAGKSYDEKVDILAEELVKSGKAKDYSEATDIIAKRGKL